MENKRYSIEIDNVEVEWFGDSEEERKEAIMMYSLCRESQTYDVIELIDLKRDRVLGSDVKVA